VAAPWGEDWQRLKFDAAVLALRDASASGEGAPSDLPLRFSEVRRLLSPSLDGGAARADLGAGAMVVSRPSLLGNVPYRVVCILGLDADALPVGRAGGDDLMATAIAVGDRDPRSDARADLLAAVGAAREHLVVTATSRDVRTNVPVPMAVVLDELLELVARIHQAVRTAVPNGLPFF
jgi:exodeoxyribonuclease V gamma subunit